MRVRPKLYGHDDASTDIPFNEEEEEKERNKPMWPVEYVHGGASASPLTRKSRMHISYSPEKKRSHESMPGDVEEVPLTSGLKDVILPSSLSAFIGIRGSTLFFVQLHGS
jgi:hypothetical protein